MKRLVAQRRVVDPYEPFPRQYEFHRSRAKYRLFGGAAGPGKSRALLEEAVYWCTALDGVDCLLLRRTFAELEKNLIEPLRRHILPLYQGQAKYNESEHVLKFSNGSNLYFGYCKSENDVYQYQGAEFFFIGIDELTMFTLKMWQFLSSRNRSAVKHDNTLKSVTTCMAGATNPGNIGHAWVKAMFIDKKPAPGMEDSYKYDSSQYDFIRARLEDNPIYANDKAYWAVLDSLPPQLRRAFKDGDWDIFAGQYFDLFSLGRHTHEHGSVEIKPWWPKWGSLDWGFQHPACFHMHTKDADRVITFDEIWGSGITEYDLGRQIVDAARGYKLQYLFISPDAFAKRGNANTVAQQIDEGIDARLEEVRRESPETKTFVPHCDPADNDRIGGARLMYQMLQSDLWTIDSLTCPKLIECLPTLIHDEDNIEDVLKVDHSEGQLGDDAYDSARYGMKSQLDNRAAPLGERIEKQVNEWITEGKLTHENPTSVMMWRRTLELRGQRAEENAKRFAYRWKVRRGGHGYGIPAARG